jgi:transcriptional regulator with XRE-family HTH domain
MCRTGRAMSELSDFLAREVGANGYRDVEAKTGVSRGSLENLVKQENTEFPKLETLEKLAIAYQLPLWRVIEMTGIDLGLSRGADELAQRLTSLADRLPEIQPIVSSLLKLHPDDLRGVVAYLDTLDRQRDRGSAPAG